MSANCTYYVVTNLYTVLRCTPHKCTTLLSHCCIAVKMHRTDLYSTDYDCTHISSATLISESSFGNLDILHTRGVNKKIKMAALKKRVLAEYSQTIVQDDVQPTKRLRLIYKPQSNENPLQLQTSQTSAEIITRLLQYEQRLPNDAQTVENDTRELMSHYDRERDDTVRCKIVTVVRELSKLPGADCDGLIDAILSVLKNEKSHKVISQWIKTLQILGSLLPTNFDLHSQLISTATQRLTDSNFTVRVSCIELIAVLSPVDGKLLSESAQPIQALLGQHASDTDSRVRTASLRALLTVHERGIKLHENLYNTCAECLNDDTESVRLAAVKLLWVVCQIYADRPAPGSDSFNEMTLLDDGFIKICNTINDVSCTVRTEAASLLGSLHNVSPRFLRQTLDKKLMSQMRRKVSAHDRARETFVSGEWATGQKWASDAPREEMNPEDISLMNIGACGAFVHGLEDEFLEVRNAAMDSLCELASQNPMFAVLSQDSIIDMFNDEIESVRLNAVNSLRKISQHIIVREDQLEIILGVLQDFSPKSRENLREMLGDMKLATKACLSACVMAILDNLNRYPQDKLSVLRLMQRFGQNHPELTSAVTPDVLSIHPYYATPEPNMQDPNYMSILVMVVNAAALNPSMLSLFQEHTWRHYHYLRSSFPHLTPVLQENFLTAVKRPTQATSETYISTALSRLSDISSMEYNAAIELLNITIRDLERLNDILASEVSSAECVALYLSTQTTLIQLLQSNESGAGSVSETSIHKILQSCDKLKHVYFGLGCQEMAVIYETELKALAMRLMSLPNHTVSLDNFVMCLMDAGRLLQSSNITPDPFTSHLLNEHSESRNLTNLQQTLQSAYKLIKPCCFTLTNQIRRISVTILEPTSSILDKPIRLTAGMTASVSLIATVNNTPDLCDVRVQVIYPDSHIDYMAIATQDITKLSPIKHHINTRVILSHCLTSDPFEVEMCLALVSKSTKTQRQQQSCDNDDYIKLCKSVKISLAPKSSRR